MNRSLLWIMMSASMAVFSNPILAEESCPVDGDKNQCEHKQWRDQEAMSDDSRVLISDVAENTERTLPQATVTLWALPPVPITSSHIYSADELKAVELAVSTTSPQFNSAKAELDPDMIKRLSGLIEQLKDKRGVRLSIVGHTDNQGLSTRSQHWFKDNHALSVARAKAVADYLQKELRLSDKAINISGKGDSQPVASNTTPTGMRKNRRVEMAIWYDEVTPGKVTTVSTPAMNRESICAGEVQSATKIPGSFAISIDGQPVDNSAKDGENTQRCTDVALADTNIRLQYDNQTAKPLLDVSAWQATATVGETIKFQGYSNYLAWIDHAEVRLFATDRSSMGEPLKIIALNDALAGEWQVSEDAPRAMQYRIRVYDAEGRYDETTSLPLNRVTEHDTVKDDLLTTQENKLIAYGNTRLEQKNIPISGGSVTIHGDSVPAGHSIVLMGQQVPVDANGKFVAQQIIPAGRHTLEIAALDPKGDGVLFWRDIELKKNDWFYVGIVDVTAGKYRANGAEQEVTQDRHLDNSSFIDGRLAFYTKGKWREKYTVTASADTREQRFSELFSTLKDKDPRSLLRRLDDTAYYPVYGDDSTLVEDAPTQGKFYAKIEDERSHAMWGNFKIVQQETDLAQINRGLYGAVVDWKSESFTSDSSSKTEVNLFAAEPGTQASLEEFRGTGGSLYYLQHQDIVTGSERVQVEVRDKDSGIVLSVNTLVAGQDYQEDAIQGRIVLTRALPSTADDSALVRAGSYAGNPVYLVVNYEYVGDLTDFNDLAVGGRATHWLNDSIRLGVTGSYQQVANNDQKLNGIDVLFRKTPETYLKLEAAVTEGPGVISNSSINGGYNFSPVGLNPTNDQSANAYQLESGFRLTDFGFETDGNGHFYARRRQDGFSAPGQLVNYDTNQYGGGLTLPLTAQDSVDLKFDVTKQDQGIDTESVDLGLHHDIDDNWTVSAGLRSESRQNNTGLLSTSNTEGDRTDLALQADYGRDNDWGLYGFTQGTLNRTGNRNANNRGGLGGHYQINDRIGLKGEASAGNGGMGALIGTDYRVSDRTTTYLNYALDPDNANSGLGNRQGKLISGLRNRYSDSVSVYGEEQFLHGDNGDGLTHAYGVDLSPNETWKFGLALESGEIESDTSLTKRRAASVAVNYAKEDVKYGGNLEFRRDETDGSRRDSWLTRNHIAYQVDPDWRLRLQLDLALSHSDNGGFYDADYVETLIGYAYRPVNNDKLNALFEYKYLADQAPSNQFTASGQTGEFEQRSHVFAVDGIYDLTSRWSIGGKYAVRIGELRAGRGEGDWYKSTAQLAIGRVDWHVVKHWDALAELRILDVKEAEDTRSGMLLAVYRHIGEHVKAGVGYNFTDFSDDLTNLDYDSRGVFFNVIGKW
tara:strand:- start:68311 stop:72447 length:4137 start_codon:yes stop_codon:yes gene_type:complete